MTVAIASIVVAFFVSLAATPLVRWLAIGLGVTDMPGARRVHVRPTPRGGGLAVAAAVAAALAIYGNPFPPGVLAGASLLLVAGIVDDVVFLGVHAKLAAQFAAALCAVIGGVRFTLAGGPPDAVEAACAVLWIVYITNALNLSDGLDGLCAGIGTIIFLWLAAAGLSAGYTEPAIPALVFAAALLGFLPYNFHPASIFLGDTGSLVIGYMVAVLPLLGMEHHVTSPLGVFLLAGLPAIDTLITIARRFVSRALEVWSANSFWRGVAAGIRNVGAADRRHIHHRLIDLGLGQREVVPLLYGVTAMTGGLAFLAAQTATWPIDLVALGLAVTVVAIVQALRIRELQLVRSGVVLPILRRLFDRRRIVVAVDLAVAAAAYASALVLTIDGAALGPLALAIAVMAVDVILVFAVLGVYRIAWRATGLAGLGLLGRACVVATVSGYVALRLLELPVHAGVALVFLGFLFSSAAMIRFSYLLLAQAVAGAEQHERALVCGGPAGARRALARLRRRGMRDVELVGLIEFRPRWQGWRLGHLPVLGTLDALDDILRQTRARHLVIADPLVRGDALLWARAVCRHRDVHVHRYVETLVPFDGPTRGEARARATAPNLSLAR